ncbi:MAG: phenylalanine--tRNA ligase subunit alpha, partial [Bifidobacterium sp.]|nr:phenylalanine--tRNA ligase subunit alpha [Bifidobacterium sp.]
MVAQEEFDPAAMTDEVNEGIGRIREASDLEELKAIKAKYAGTGSALAGSGRIIGRLPADQKKTAGRLAGKLKADFGRAYGLKERQLRQEEESRRLAAEQVDMTLPV